uniref:tRNA-specific adenosine deaminase 1 n=1 Tax=Strigamia maritima TaxID=126957 RepID=T1IZ90_STRMM
MVEIGDDEFGNRVGKLCFSYYDKLVKTGKPQKGKEWTHFAAILVTKQKDDGDQDLEIVSMATGTKCVGISGRNMNGYVLHDSHAEVLARRAFLRYLYFEICQAARYDSSDVLNYSRLTGTCSLKPNVNFHMFVSHTPCGDASIFPKTPATDNEIGIVIDDDGNNDTSDPKPKRQKLHTTNDQDVEDIQRTGAKCLPTGPQDLHLPGVNYHITKLIRLKPGRGEPTRSLSCSDKIAKCPFSKTALHRAIIERIKDVSNLPPDYRVNTPDLVQSTCVFADGRFTTSLTNVLPCPSGTVIWSAVPETSIEVTVQGKKQGVTKKAGLTDKAACSVCKKKLLDQFHVTRLTINKLKSESLKLENQRTYYDWKTSAVYYQKAKTQLQNAMKDWPPSLS